MSSESVSTQKTISTSSDLLDKDELIDDLNSQLGNFLSVKQELCAIKNENEIIKSSMIANEKLLKDEREQSTKKIEQLTQEIETLKETVALLTSENDQKKTLIDNLMEELQKHKEEIETSKENSEVEINKQVNLQTASLTAALEEKRSQIQELKCEITELRTELKSNNETLTEKKVDYQKLLNDNEKLVNEKNAAINEANQLKIQIKDYQTQYSCMKEQSDELNKNINELNEVNTSLKQEILDRDQKIESLNQNIHELTQRLDEINSLFPDSSDVVESVQILQEDAMKLASQVKKDHVKIKNARNILIEQQNMIEMKEKEMSELQNQLETSINQNTELQSQIEQYSSEISKLSKQAKMMDDRFKYTAAVIRAQSDLTQQSNKLKQILTPDLATPTLRNVVISVILARRWRDVKSEEKTQKTDDPRNWWWITTSKTAAQNDMISAVQNMKQNVCDLNNQINELKSIAAEGHSTVKEANETIENKERQILQEKKNSENYLHQIELLQIKLSEMVPKAQYEALNKKLLAQRSKLVEAIKSLQENEQIVSSLRSRLQSSEENREKNGINAGSLTIEVKRLRQQLKEANIEIEILNQALNGKRKDILSLERGILSEKRSRAALSAQCYSLAAENQDLVKVVINQDSTPELKKVEEVTLAKRLKEMSRNMAGTMFNQ